MIVLSKSLFENLICRKFYKFYKNSRRNKNASGRSFSGKEIFQVGLKKTKVSFRGRFRLKKVENFEIFDKGRKIPLLRFAAKTKY